MDYSKLRIAEAKRLAAETTDIDVILELTKHPDALVRKYSLREMCPCRVKNDIELFWKRVVEMVDDKDALVRAQVK